MPPFSIFRDESAILEECINAQIKGHEVNFCSFCARYDDSRLGDSM